MFPKICNPQVLQSQVLQWSNILVKILRYIEFIIFNFLFLISDFNKALLN